MVDAEFGLIIQTAEDGLVGAQVEMGCKCVHLMPQNKVRNNALKRL